MADIAQWFTAEANADTFIVGDRVRFIYDRIAHMSFACPHCQARGDAREDLILSRLSGKQGVVVRVDSPEAMACVMRQCKQCGEHALPPVAFQALRFGILIKPWFRLPGSPGISLWAGETELVKVK